MACRLAIVSTPRSGNMWLRRLLAGAHGLEERSADTPGGVRWRELPDRCVLQLHWAPTDDMLAPLAEHGFRTIALTRHPLDVLVSILHFAQAEPRTARWLNGEGGDERELLGADPCSDAFRHYAVGPRAKALLSLTVQWHRSDRLDASIAYEQLVADPIGELDRLNAVLGLAPTPALEAAVEANGIEQLRAENGNGHFWQGRPGHWRSLLPAGIAEEIAAAHEPSFAELGYSVDPDPRLDERIAHENWARIADAGATAQTPTVVMPLGSPESLVGLAYRLVLGREPDPPARERAVAALRTGTLSPAMLMHELATSAEAEQVRLFDNAIAFAAWARSAGERPRALTAPADSSERLVELPWTLARYRGERSVLDVGYAFAEPAYLTTLPLLGAERIVGVDLAVSPVRGLDTVAADVRSLPFDDAEFDLVFCISTLQCVGRDNRIYGLAAEHDPDGPLSALRELRRVVGDDGRLLVTVPCGEEQDLGWFVQHTRRRWERLFAAADLHPFEEQVYELGDEGWRPADTFDEAGLRYAERGAGASAVLCAELRPGRRRQATRRAVRHARRRLRGEATYDR